MSNKKNLNENTTKSSEFVCSAFGWKTQDKQKERAEDLQNITKNRKNKNNKDK